MSVEVKVALNTGASMGYENDHTAGSPDRAIVALDQGYKQIREWLLTQLSPADQAKFRGAPEQPQPEKRVREIVRETIQDEAKRSGRRA